MSYAYINASVVCGAIGYVGHVAGDTRYWPGTCPTDGISIEFGFRSGLGVLWFGVCSADRGAILHTSRPLHLRGVCEISLWSVDAFWAGARQSFVGFWVRSGYRWWDGRQSCEICPCTSILMTKISFHFLFLLFACCIMSCHVGNKLH